MKINKIQSISNSTKAHSGYSSNDQQKFLSEAQYLDNKLNARAGFRNELSMSQEEYKKQSEISKKLGFDGVLADEIDKLAKNNKK